MIRMNFKCLAPWVMLLWAGVAAAEAPPSMRRLALVIGANDGGAGRVHLRYATTDAQAFANVLATMGGVGKGDTILLLDPDRQAVQRGMDELAARSQRAKGEVERVEAMIYYSGHSDETGVLLSGERYPYQELRRALREIKADVRIAVLDSCSSGALVRMKGGTRRPAFVLDNTASVTGHAILTSSSADEAAQESDTLGGSYFTQALISGMRGAADISNDGKVTLNEAYQFAFNETLSRTEKTMGGPQHPAYDIQLAGSGDVVMTDLRSTSAGLLVRDSVYGRLLVRDGDGRLVAELYKAPGRPMELGMPAGRYDVLLRHDDLLYQTHVELLDGGRTDVDIGMFQEVPLEVAMARGNAKERRSLFAELGREAGQFARNVDKLFEERLRDDAEVDDDAPVDSAVSEAGSGKVTRFAIGGWTDEPNLRGAALSFGFNNVAQRFQGFQLALGGNQAGLMAPGAQVALGFNSVKGSARGGQFSVGMNAVTEADLNGLQMTVGANFAAHGLEGAQLAAGVNTVGGHLKGLQLTSGINLAKSMNGAQIGVVNMLGSGEGLELGALSVRTGAFKGAAINVANIATAPAQGLELGVLNLNTRTVTGAQLGTVNVAAGGVNGVQVGVVNIAKDADAALGLINIMWAGRWNIESFVDDTGITRLALQNGARYTHWRLLVGLETDTPHPMLAAGLSLGARLPISALWALDLDASAEQLIHRQDGGWRWDADDASDGQSLLSTVSATVAWELLPHIAVFAGPCYHLLVSEALEAQRFSARKAQVFRTGEARQNDHFDPSVVGWVGGQVGLRFRLH